MVTYVIAVTKKVLFIQFSFLLAEASEARLVRKFSGF